MKQLLLLLFFVLLGSGSLLAQDIEDVPKKREPKTIFRLGLILPSLLVEQKIADNATLVLNFWVGFLYRFSQSSSGNSSEFYPNINLMVEPRFYTTKETRRSKGKRTDYFSGGYIGLPVNIRFTDSRSYGGCIYGFQSTIGKKGFWNVGIGFGINNYQYETRFGLIGDFGIGFILN